MESKELIESADSLTSDDFEALYAAVRERKYREEMGLGTFAEACDEYAADPTCPARGSDLVVRSGRTRTGSRRHGCSACGKRSDALTGTAVEGMRCDFPTFVGFARPMGHNPAIDAVAGTCGITHAPAWEWRHRALGSVSGHQDRTGLRDEAWIDGTLADDTGPCPRLGGGRKQGPSKEKARICVAIDSHTSVVARRAGNGKPLGNLPRKMSQI